MGSGKAGDMSQSGLSAKYPYTFKRVFPKCHRVGGARKTRSELVTPGRTTFLQLKGQVALCPQTIVLFLATCSSQQLGFKPCSLPLCPIPGCDGGSRTSGSSWPGQTGERRQGPEAPRGTGDRSSHLCPELSPCRAAPPEDHPPRRACGALGRGCCQPGRNAAVGAALGA